VKAALHPPFLPGEGRKMNGSEWSILAARHAGITLANGETAWSSPIWVEAR